MEKKQIFKLSITTILIALLMVLITVFTCVMGTSEIYAESVNSKNIIENVEFQYTIFYDEINRNGSVKACNASEEEVSIIDVDLNKVAEYSFSKYNKAFNGEIYAEEAVTEARILNKISDIQKSIANGNYFDGHNIDTKQRLVGTFSKDANWLCVDERKVDVILDYNKKHYGDFSEWRSVFKLSNTKDSDYYAFINESYIKPDGDKTDFRSEKLTYKFNPTLGATTELRDYAPKMKGPERTVSYAVSAGGNVSSDGQAEISSSISTSYLTLEKSPSIQDNGNMLNNYGEIAFSYLKPYDNSGEFYTYNISQSYQSSSFVTKSKKYSGNIVIQDNRTVGIVRDAVWSNTLVNFNINTKLTIYR